MQFANPILHRTDDKHIIFSDKATFHIGGHVNRHNGQPWREDTSHVVQGHIRGRIFGPFFFVENTINVQVYLDMLESFCFLRYTKMASEIPQVFQQDGAEPNFSYVMEDLSTTFTGRWTGRGGSILWPPRSPDLTPLDFFFWSYAKNYVYMDKIRDPNHLREE
jgi:hypothetical protein